MASYKPRLAAFLYNKERGIFGIIEFYEGNQLVERLKISEIRSLGVSVIKQPFGVSLVTGLKTYIVTSWPKTEQKKLVFAKCWEHR